MPITSRPRPSSNRSPRGLTWPFRNWPSSSSTFLLRNPAVLGKGRWPRLAARDFARRRAYDYRLALTLIRQGVQDFATVNVEEFEGLGFRRVWNPLER